MREFIAAGIAVKDGFSADHGNGNGFQKLRNVLREVSRVVVRRFQNGDFDKLARVERVGKRFQEIVGDTALPDLGNGRNICRNRF